MNITNTPCVQLCFLCIIRTLTDAYSKSFQVSNLTHISLIRQLEYKIEVIICVQLIPGEGSSTNKHFVGYAIDVSHLATCVQLCFLCIIRTLTDAYSKSFQVSNLTHISLIRQLEYKIEVIICVQLIPGEGSSTNKHFVGYAIDVSHLAEILIFGLHSKKITFFGNSFFTIHICQELFQTVIAIYTGHLQCSG